jgi:hypothetical protein
MQRHQAVGEGATISKPATVMDCTENDRGFENPAAEASATCTSGYAGTR